MRAIEVSMEQHQNEMVGETGDPRENAPSNGIVRHDSHMRNSGVTRPGIEPGSPWWEASRLTAHPPVVHTRRTQQGPATRGGGREKRNVLRPLTRERRGAHCTRAVAAAALLLLSGRCITFWSNLFFILLRNPCVPGLCYAEFGAQFPKAGSAYTYSYVSMGEFIAFIIGWNLILEYVIGSASVVRGLSMYLDSMMNDAMKNAFISFAPINVSILSPYFDFFAFVISLVLAVILAVGVKESSYVNSVLTLVNIAVILFVIIVGSVQADAGNWKIRREDIPVNVNGGEGGFLPFGIAGVLKGAATCFYGFVGFDCIATTGEEVKKPQRAIPFAILLSLMIVFVSYFGISTVLTMMVPYYQQDEDAPIPYVFMSVGWPVAKWIVSVGGIFGLCARYHSRILYHC
ncbi:hypothetical protein PR048_000622 [Dryococelus australis]|uniref:Cationic amino acid transporter n=1 Tax=Dryococelus australis TaxID=614101 RepID=A0ABQ9IFR1_9NEOP|nr:hypothetical protein PR048_000622 [Dryococelus australis]